MIGEKLVEALIPIVRAAGKKIMQVYQKRPQSSLVVETGAASARNPNCSAAVGKNGTLDRMNADLTGRGVVMATTRRTGSTLAMSLPGVLPVISICVAGGQ